MADYVPVARRLRSRTTALERDLAIADSLTPELIQKNPLENPLIINSVFGFLNLRTIKQCRLVSKKWNDISIGFMEKMAITVLRSPRRIRDFEKSFPETEDEFSDIASFAFLSFKLEPPSPSKWPSSTISGFLEGHRQNMRELSFKHINAYKDRNRFSISPHIDNRLNHLTIDKCVLSVSIDDKLSSTKFLSLDCCQVDIVNNYKLAPIGLKMCDVVVVRNKEKVNDFLVNEILSFKNLKDLSLHYSRCNPPLSKLSINLSDETVAVENLTLEYVTVNNFEESKWKVAGKLKLKGIPFTSNNQMEFSDLHFARAAINLNSLPQSLKRLSLEMRESERIIEIVASSRLVLPNLNYLWLDANWIGQGNAFSSLALFAHCPNLTVVTLLGELYDTLQILNTDWIPRSVKTLVLGNHIEVVGKDITLEKLVMVNIYPNMPVLLTNLLKLKSNHLILDFSSLSSKPKPKGFNYAVLEIIKMSYHSLVLGNLKTLFSYDSFCWISEYVDKRARQYLFENEKGKAISVDDYKTILGAEISNILRNF